MIVDLIIVVNAYNLSDYLKWAIFHKILHLLITIVTMPAISIISHSLQICPHLMLINILGEIKINNDNSEGIT